MPMIDYRHQATFECVWMCKTLKCEYIEKKKNKPHKVVDHQQQPKERIYEEAEDCWFQLHIVVQAAQK